MKDLTRAIYLISAFILFFMIWCLFAIESVAFSWLLLFLPLILLILAYNVKDQSEK